MSARLVVFPFVNVLRRQHGLCRQCGKAIEAGQSVVRNGSCCAIKYYHPECAQRINLWLGVLPLRTVK